MSDVSPSYLHEFDGYVYFNAFDSTHGSELWKTDGSSLNTELAADVLDDGTLSGNPIYLQGMGGSLFSRPLMTPRIESYGR